jgi:hypothetical protein
MAERAVQGHRLNGGRSPLIEAWAASAARGAALQRASGIGISELPIEADQASSAMVDPLSATEAAKHLGKSVRNVTDLCRRGSLGSAQRLGGRWFIERAEVSARIQDRRAS